MKRLRIVLILIAVAVLTLPPVFGILTESQVHARVESLRANETLSVEIESFERGWFSSTALLSIAPAVPAGARAGAIDAAGDAAANDVMEVMVDFNHGPVSMRDGFFLGASEFMAYPNPTSAATAASPAPAAAYPFEFHGHTSFDGELNFVAELPPLDLALEIGAVSFSGGRITGTVEGRHLTANAEADTFRFESDSGSVALQGLRASADNDILSRYVMPGVFEVEVARASVDTGGVRSAGGIAGVEMSALALRTEVGVDANGALLDASLSIAVETARAPGMRTGEETGITNTRFDATAQHLDVAALEAYLEARRRVAGGSPASFEELEPATERLLAAGPTLSINPLRFDLDGAPFELTLLAETLPAALPETGPLDLGNPEFWYEYLTGNAKLAAAKPLVERAAKAIAKSQLSSEFMQGSAVPFEALDTMAEAQAGFVLAMLATQGMIEDTGSLYRMELRLENGSLTANGNPLPFGLR